MCFYPYTHLLPVPDDFSRVVAISGPSIHVISVKDGLIRSALCSEVLPPSKEEGKGAEPGVDHRAIRCAAVSPECLATSGDDKTLRVWDINTLTVQSNRELPKKSTAIVFADEGQSILVADKFGDVFRYSLAPSERIPARQESGTAKDALASHGNSSGGELVLGHVSVLTTFIMSPDGRYIITADRDEHIRVSWYPQGFNIESYCLGHEKFVSAIHIPRHSPSHLISGGGDSVLKVWDWMTGTLTFEKPLDFATSAILVKPPKPQDLASEKGRRFKKGKSKKQKDPATPEKVEALSADTARTDVQTALVSDAESASTVTVVHKIATVQPGSQILFSLVGSGKLFVTTFEASSSTHLSFDFEKPVLDFAVLDYEQGIVLVSLDSQWRSEPGPDILSSAQGSTAVAMTCTVQIHADKITKYSLPNLENALNSDLISATPQRLDALDIYGALVSMPKGVAELMEDGGGGASAEEKPMSKKAFGRMKNKMAVLERALTKGPSSSAGDRQQAKKIKP